MVMNWMRETDRRDIATKQLAYYDPILRMAASAMSCERPDMYEEMVRAGRISLLRLFRKTDSSLNLQTEACAMKSVIDLLKHYLIKKDWYIQVPKQISEQESILQQTIEKLRLDLKRSPRINEIAEQIKLTPEETIEILASRECSKYESLHFLMGKRALKRVV